MVIKEAHLERRRRNYQSEDCVQNRRAMAVQSKGEEQGIVGRGCGDSGSGDMSVG